MNQNHNESYTELRRGQIWHINPGTTTTTGCETWSNRPAIIVSNDVTCEKSNFVEVVYLTTQKRKHRLPTHVNVISGGKKAIALCEQIHTVDKQRIGFYISTVDAEAMQDVDRALLFSLGVANTAKPSTLFKKWANAAERYNIDLTEDYPKDTDETSDVNASCACKDDVNLQLKELASKMAVYKRMYQMEHDARVNYEKTFEEIKEPLQSLKNMHDLESVLSILDGIGKSANFAPDDELKEGML